MAEDLQAMLTQINEKFDLTFQQLSPQLQPPETQAPTVNPQNLTSQPQLTEDPQKPSSLPQTAEKSAGELFCPQSQQQSHFQAIEISHHSHPHILPTSTKPQPTADSNIHGQQTSQEEPTGQSNPGREFQQYDMEKQIKLQGETDEISGQSEQLSQLMSYQSLTEKFDVALSRIKHNTSATYKSEFAARQQHYQRKKTTDLNLLRVQKQKAQSQKCTAKPLINSYSQHLLVNHKPIHQRYEAVLRQKQRRIQTEQAGKQARIAEEEALTLKDMKDRQEQLKKKLGQQIRTEDEYYNEMKAWAEHRDKRVEELAQKKEVEANDATFKPQINQKSQTMMKKKTERVPIYEKQPIPKRIVVDSNCTFKPNLSKTAKK